MFPHPSVKPLGINLGHLQVSCDQKQMCFVVGNHARSLIQSQVKIRPHTWSPTAILASLNFGRVKNMEGD